MTRRERKTVVILDLGNVVLDYDVERILASLALDPEIHSLLRDELFGHPQWLELDRGSMDEADIRQSVGQRTGLDDDLIADALLAMKNSLDPIPQTLALMQELAAAGLPLYCLSNMSRETWAHINDHELFDLFEGVLISGHEGMIKPDPAIFERMLERFAIAADTSLFVDDLQANVDSARTLGIDAFHFRRSADCYAALRALLLD